jgi:hypothetical protein
VIDWASLGANAVWVLGLSIVLAALSYRAWLASAARGRTAADGSSAESWRVPGAFGMLLATLGWAAAQAGHWWTRALCLALAVSFAWDVARLSGTRRQR